MIQEPALLVVDDVPDIVAEMVSMLELVGVPALGADSVQNALRVLRAEPTIRAVICDLHLQQDDGRTLFALLHDEPGLASRSLGGIWITGDSDIQGVDVHGMGGQTSPVTLLRKPIDPDEVIACVRRCLCIPTG